MRASDPKIVAIHSHQRIEGSRGASDGGAGLLTLDAAIGRHLDTLYGAARLMTGAQASAEDLVQETAIAAFRAWGSLRRPEAVKAWLLRILYRTYLSHRRQERRRPALVDLDVDELLDDPILGHEPDLPSPQEALSEDVALALSALPDGFREALWLIDVEELTIAEAADVMEVPPGTVASRVYRARRLLRERLSGSTRNGGEP